jgi:adenosylcobinamide-GDP ribazoletransferase
MIKREWGRMAAAVTMLTVLPMPGKRENAGSSAYYPLAGWLIGGALYGIMTLLGSVQVWARAFIVVAAWTLVSRGLHLDGLADTADGLIAGGPRERILRIMHDSFTGAFGVLAIVLLLLGKFAFVSSLKFGVGRNAVLCAAVVGRFSLTLVCATRPAAREDGLASEIIGTTKWVQLLIAAVLTFVPLGILFRTQALYACFGLLPALALAFYAGWKIGGVTGDVLGACLELTELGALFAFLFV